MRSAVLSLGLMLLIVGCTGQRYGSSKTAEGVANQQHTTAPAGSELQGLRVNVALSDKAKKKLIESKETVIVAGYFTGTPKQGALKLLLVFFFFSDEADKFKLTHYLISRSVRF